jgi:hypothetical protein
MIGYIGPNGARMITIVKIILGLLSTISKYDSRIYFDTDNMRDLIAIRACGLYN